MKLYHLLNLIQDEFPLKNTVCGGIDSRPNSVFTVTLCFMAEEETWVTVPVDSEILIPWYDCEIHSIQGSEKKFDIQVWLNDVEYIREHWKGYVDWGDGDGNR